MRKTGFYHLVLNQKGQELFSVDHEGELAVEEVKQSLKPPPLYTVVMLNDDFTPMDFVVEVLQKFFSMNEEKATQTMLVVHKQGQACCGVYTKDVAETKALQVNRYARDNQHPLLCEIQQMQS